MKVARLVGYTGEALDITAAGSNAISTATNKVASKVFSAIAGTATGSRGAFNSDALYQASLQAIFKQMDADRTNVWSQIMISTQDKLPKYPMYQAQDDLYTYYKAGTIQSAMDSLDASTGAAATTCKAAAAAVSNAVKVVKVSGGAGSGGPTVDQPNGATQATSSGGADPGSSAKDAGAATPTNTGQCSQMLQSANQALVMIGVQAKATVSKKAALSKFIKEQLSENKSYLDKVANILSVDISTFPDQSSYNKERGKVLIALSAESDQSTINDVANELQSLTGKDPSK